MYGPQTIVNLLPLIGAPNELAIFLLKEYLQACESSKNKENYVSELDIFIKTAEEFRKRLAELRDGLFTEIEASISGTVSLSVKLNNHSKIDRTFQLEDKDMLRKSIELAREVEQKTIKDVQTILGTQIDKILALIAKAEELKKPFL